MSELIELLKRKPNFYAEKSVSEFQIEQAEKSLGLKFAFDFKECLRKFGAVSLAQKSNAYLVPFAITGDYPFRTKNLCLTFAKPFKVQDMDLKTANKKLYDVIYKMIKEDNDEKIND